MAELIGHTGMIEDVSFKPNFRDVLVSGIFDY